MSSFVSRWVVCRRHAVSDHDLGADGVLRDDAIEGWIREARDAYLERCAVMRDMIAGSELVLRTRAVEVPGGAVFGRPASVVVSAGVTEVFPTSFTMAFRVRSYGPTDSSRADDTVVNAACRVSLDDPATGEPTELGNAVRDELIALEHAARHTN